MANSRICSIPGCCKPVRVKSRGWCNAHWLRWSRYGDPLAGQFPRDEPYKFLHETVLSHNGKEECLFWPYSKTSDGYGRIGINRKRVPVHRYVCEKEHGPPPTPEHESAHSCGKGHLGCVNRHHLSWKTRAENFADKLIHGTDNRGEKNGAVKLDEGRVKAVKKLLRKGTPRKEIARMTGVDRWNINHIANGTSWAWLE